MLLRGFIWSLKQHCLKFHEGKDTTCDISNLVCFHNSELVSELMKFFNEYDYVDAFKENLSNLDIHCKEANFGKFTLKNGLYLRALLDAILEIGQLFVEDLVKLELLFNEGCPEVVTNEVSSDMHTPFSTISKLYQIYFKMHQFINCVAENNLSGCQILDLCLKSRYGFPEEIYFILLKSLNRPMLKQTVSWILFGVLEDPRDEFFIKHVDSLSCDISAADEASGSLPCPTSASELTEEIYEIRSEFLPSHVSFSLANKILNTGKLVSLVHHAPSETYSLPNFKEKKFGIDENEIIKNMKDFDNFNDNLHLTKVERIVHSVWVSINQEVKKLAEDVGGLFKQHRMLTDIYLMQRGNIMNQFVKLTFHTLKADVKKTSNHYFNLAFKNAISDSGSNQSWYTDCLSFTLPLKYCKPDGTLCMGTVELNYKKPWPLEFIFTADVMKKYNRIFRFLLELKYAHLNLSNVRNECSRISPELMNRAMIIMMKLQQVLINLESYIYYDVIQSENETWEAAVVKVKTFNDIKLLHMNFLTNILLNTFLIHSEEEDQRVDRRRSMVDRELGSLIINEKIEKVFTLTDNFVQVLKNYKEAEEFERELSAVNSSLNDLVKNIIKIINNVYKENDLPTSLLLRLNYNRFYSTL